MPLAMSLSCKYLPLGLVLAAISVSLLGCGDEPPVPTPRTTTTTTTLHPRTPPMSGPEVAKLLNELYMGFDASNDTSPLGVSISMAGAPHNFFANIFCSTFENPNGKTGCFNGGADCRLSASLYNHKMILDHKTKVTKAGMDRYVGFVINQSKVEESLAKCSFVWDGASGNRYNRGCGLGAPGTNCSLPGTAYDNICPSTKKTCTATDTEVTNSYCQPIPGGLHPIPPTHQGEPQCLFPGPAINYHGQDDYEPSKESLQYLRQMVKARVERNDGHDPEGPNIEKWNEIVIDELLFLPELWYDPALMIPAFVYPKSKATEARSVAQSMVDSFSKDLQVPPIPLLMIDDTQLRPEGPFVADPVELETVATII
mmetsp:Transcript_55811/g.133020  ORF Transcript_55811/g.133020 Transcript_55811/m.133020 type:complete len:370 (+) Transcript_55811:101-1210(+)|eukprot:CAMPEP_0178406198 /NCGR_PEP_ID=MMETSP0689_2-20121128/18790_1 /TAXON_ID=160604 /ORGANISM="Amphidinium massartii, Strain CS-259" /LENGTH=369 /DNA_ID=CAMNT_0020027235 /DNA_START=103 /DNA_END=1212 /DNA_ORIENTATION=+